MKMMQIRLFGRFEVRVAEGEPLGLTTLRSVQLFSFLVLHRQRLFSRDRLTAALDPRKDPGAARKALRKDLWRIRSELQEHGVDPQVYFRSQGEAVGFMPPAGRYWLDVERFEGLLHSNEALGTEPGRDRIRRLETATALYRGDLLETLDAPWCTAERTRLRSLLMVTLRQLYQEYADRGELNRALDHCHRMLALDPMWEQANRAMMRILARLGNRPAALKVYDRCRDLLRNEMNVEPEPATRALAERIAAGVPLLTRWITEKSATEVEDLRARLRTLDSMVESLGHLVAGAAESFEAFVDRWTAPESPP